MEKAWPSQHTEYFRLASGQNILQAFSMRGLDCPPASRMLPK